MELNSKWFEGFVVKKVYLFFFGFSSLNFKVNIQKLIFLNLWSNMEENKKKLLPNIYI